MFRNFLFALFIACFQFVQVSPHVYVHPLSALSATIRNLKVFLQLETTLVTNATEFIRNGQPVNVSWQGVKDPNEWDILGLYVPADADPSLAVPVQYIYARSSGEHLSQGQGWAVFHLINMRQSYGFKFLKNGFKKPEVIAISGPINNKIPNQPTQGHLGVGPDRNSIVVQWISGEGQPQQVQYGSNMKSTLKMQHVNRMKGKMRMQHDIHTEEGIRTFESSSFSPSVTHSSSVFSTTTSYTSEDMCGYPADSVGWLDPGFMHSAVIPLQSIQPGTSIDYRFGSEAYGWSEIHSFTVSPRPGVRSDPPLKFLAFNDVAMSNSLLFNNKCPPWCPEGLSFSDAYGQNSTKLPPFLEKEEGVHLALMIGDLAYGIGYAADWDFFGNQFEQAFTKWPLAIGMGNHERDWPGTGDAFQDMAYDSGGECGIPASKRFNSPVRGNPSLLRRPVRKSKAAPSHFYSFDMGAVHFLIIDSEVPSSPDTEQGRFIASDLASVNRSLTPWIIAGMHRMMWAPASWRSPVVGDLDNEERLQRDLEDLFMQYQVNIVIQGHEHAYARTCMLFRGTCVDHLGSGGHETERWSASLDKRKQRFKKENDKSDTAALIMPSSDLHDDAMVISSSGSTSTRSSISMDALPTHAPIYILAGNAGAGFTHGFPDPLPEWVEVGFQDRNGYLRFEATYESLVMEAVSTDDGSIMDRKKLIQ